MSDSHRSFETERVPCLVSHGFVGHGPGLC